MLGRVGAAIALAALLSAGLTAGPARAAITTAPSVTYDNANFLMTYTPTDATTRSVAPGSAVDITGDWRALYTGLGCPNCYTSFGLIGLPPWDEDLLVAQASFHPLVHTPYVSSVSGSYSGSFTAPLTPGTYYIGANFVWDFSLPPGLVGLANADNQVSYIINVTAVPEPFGAALLGTALLGLTAARRRAAPRQA